MLDILPGECFSGQSLAKCPSLLQQKHVRGEPRGDAAGRQLELVDVCVDSLSILRSASSNNRLRSSPEEERVMLLLVDACILVRAWVDDSASKVTCLITAGRPMVFKFCIVSFILRTAVRNERILPDMASMAACLSHAPQKKTSIAMD